MNEIFYFFSLVLRFQNFTLVLSLSLDANYSLENTWSVFSFHKINNWKNRFIYPNCSKTALQILLWISYMSAFGLTCHLIKIISNEKFSSLVALGTFQVFLSGKWLSSGWDISVLSYFLYNCEFFFRAYCPSLNLGFFFSSPTADSVTNYHFLFILKNRPFFFQNSFWQNRAGAIDSSHTLPALHMHSLPHYQHPPPAWDIGYDWWTSTDTPLSPRVHGLW